MILTEEEAHTKRCQESFGDRNVSPAGFVVPGPYASSPMLGEQVAVYTSPAMCIASGCMAWRWEAWTMNGSILEIAGPRKGYCGKAGVP